MLNITSFDFINFVSWISSKGIILLSLTQNSLLAQKPSIVPIPGTRNLDHLKENLEAINIKLTTTDLTEMEAAFAKIQIHGGRMNAVQMKVVEY